jgi:hypothetical protein
LAATALSVVMMQFPLDEENLSKTIAPEARCEGTVAQRMESAKEDIFRMYLINFALFGYWYWVLLVIL